MSRDNKTHILQFSVTKMHFSPALHTCSVCDCTAHAPLKELTRECMMPSQKYTSSQHGNKCLKEEIRSVTKVDFVSKDKASLVRKDTTGHVKKISPGGSGLPC